MDVVKRLIPFCFRLGGRVSPGLAARFAVSLFLSPKRHPRSEEEEQFWARGRREVFPSGAVARIYGDGPRVWFVHGWEGRGSQFATFVEALIPAGYSAVVWEGPAHGESPGVRTNLMQFSRWLETDLRSEREEALAVVAHSFGGTASMFACRAGAPVKRLVMISSPASIQQIFSEFWELIELPKRAQEKFLRRIEVETGFNPETISIESTLPHLSQTLAVIHDHDDKEIPYSNAETLKLTREDVYLISTLGFGHRRILKSSQVAHSVVGFLRTGGIAQA